MARRNMMLAGLLVVVMVGVGAERKEGAGGGGLAELLKARVATAEEGVKYMKAARDRGLATADEVTVWMQRWLDARLEVAGTKQERIGILKEGVELAKERERSAEDRMRNGLTGQSEVLAARYSRLEAEIRLARAEGE